MLGEKYVVVFLCIGFIYTFDIISSYTLLIQLHTTYIFKQDISSYVQILSRIN